MVKLIISLRYFIELAYDGTAYHGWQVQPEVISVQEAVEKALSLLLKKAINLVAAGRTDAGVHALQMFAHFDFDQIIGKSLISRLNSYLSKDIVIYDIFQVNNGAHARFDATSRSYLYKINSFKNPFSLNQAYQFFKPLDLEAMNTACRILFEYTDFECFSKVNTDVKTFNCEIMQANWDVQGHEIHFNVTADRFLRNMVRAIVGTMINIGLGKLKPEDLHHIISSKNRSEAGYSVPAHGLYLTKIAYPYNLN